MITIDKLEGIISNNIPSIYDLGVHSVPEFLYALAEKLNQVIGNVDYLLGPGLEKEVVEKLNIWLEDGTLANLINVTIFKDLNDKIDNNFNTLNSSLETKVSKGNATVNDINKNLGKFDQSYMTDEFLQQIVGTTPINATPSDKSVTVQKLAFDTVDCIKSENLFNKYDVTSQKYIGANGSLVFNGSYTTSNVITVLANTEYVYSWGLMHTGAMYDSSGNFIQMISTNPFTTTPNTAYVKISMKNENVTLLKLQKGYVVTKYKNNALIDKNSIQDITKDMLSDDLKIESRKSKNLFDKTTVINDKYITPTGVLSTGAGYYVGDYIAIKQGVTYCVSKLWNYALYDTSVKFIELKDTQTFTPTKDGYVRIVGKTTNINLQQLEVGNTPTTFEEFGKSYIDGKYIFNSDVNIKKIITVEKSGGMFSSITSALASITDASDTNRYEIRVGIGTFEETFRTKNYVDIIGKDKYKTIIAFTGDVATWNDTSTIFAESECKLANFTVEGTDTKYPMHIDKATGQWTCILENVRMIHRGSNTDNTKAGTPIGIGLFPYQHLILKNCEMKFIGKLGQAFGASGVYFHNQIDSVGDGYRSIRIEECDIGGTTYGIRPNDVMGNSTLQNNDAFIINNNIRATHQEYYYPENSPSWNILKKGNEYKQG